MTLGVRRTFGVVAPPVWLMTLPISPLGPMQIVIKSWNLTLGLLGASKARVRSPGGDPDRWDALFGTSGPTMDYG